MTGILVLVQGSYAEKRWSEPILNLSGMLRVGKRGYLLTENYFVKLPGDDAFILSFGGRTVWPKLSVDYALFSPLNVSEEFVAIPWLSITIPLGKS